VNRWRIDLEYRGTDFAGWQLQPRQRTVQGVVETALEEFVGHPARVHGCGRTDSGVHARQQVASFDTVVDRSVKSVISGLNAYLPDDVACVHAELAALDFDPRRWVVRKTYRYQWLDRPSRSPLFADRAWHVKCALDVEQMHLAAQYLVGRQDFSAFRASKCSASHPVRQVESATVYRVGQIVRLDIVGNGFLQHMVRIIAGTLAAVGHGQPSAELAAILALADRQRAGRTAPPHGLTLFEVEVGKRARPWAPKER
jgi:tRNA pseudouridine38-40 synthase